MTLAFGQKLLFFPCSRGQQERSRLIVSAYQWYESPGEGFYRGARTSILTGEGVRLS